jgi:hypothetical protein
MTKPHPANKNAQREQRLHALREEAQRTGRVSGEGAQIAGGPIPAAVPAMKAGQALAGYFGQPVAKPPVWTWQVGLYLFTGGLAGMAALIGFVAMLAAQPREFVLSALWVAFAGAVISPVLLIWDLGHPGRFLAMLRVYKRRSAMSMGVWALLAFGGFTTLALLLAEKADALLEAGVPAAPLSGLFMLMGLGAALTGLVLATYTGVLLGATAIPAWFVHARLLPVHFGAIAVGSAAAALELLGFHIRALNAVGLAAAAAETGVGIWIEARRHGAVDRALRQGLPGFLLRAGGLLAGPVSFLLRLGGQTAAAGVSFLVAALVSRYGWLAAGRASAGDPEAAFAAQRQRSGE